jgi:hypothetical protein
MAPDAYGLLLPAILMMHLLQRVNLTIHGLLHAPYYLKSCGLHLDLYLTMP